MSMTEKMEEPPQVAFNPSQKRPFEEDAVLPVSTPQKEIVPADVDSPLTVLSSIASPSPLKSSVLQTNAPASSNTSTAGDVPLEAPVASSNGPQPAKRRKLTPQEKEQQRLEKEAREKAKAEKKAQKEAEEKAKAEQRAQKDEEKRQKDEERRKKNEEKEEKKRAKEMEQQQKEEEKRKKERSQMRLNAFFVKPKAEADSSVTAAVDASHAPAPASISLTPDVPMQDANPVFLSPQKKVMQRAQSEYERYFLPFQLPSHAVMAPENAFMEDPNKLAAATSRIDELIHREDVPMGSGDIKSLKEKFPVSVARGLSTPRITDIVDRINGSSDNPIDLTEEIRDAPQDPLQLLRQVPMKYMRFPEDIRPPYYGTYTQPYSPHAARKLARNPYSRTLHETDYDYDSELEWEEPEEGEDLDSEGGDDLDDEGDDDMEGFLDDEEDAQVKRRLLSGDLVPVSTGLCWEDSRGVSRLNDGSDAICTDFKEFKMGFLLEPQPHAIDPFSTAYWAPEPISVISATPTHSKDAAFTSLMQPPRIPLTQRPANGMLNTLNTLNTSSSPANAASKPAKAPKRLIPSEKLPQFKQEVEGSDLTKIALIEALKKKFPKLPKDAISNTLSAVAARVGAKEVDKRWVLK